MRDMKCVSLDIYEIGYLLDACLRSSHLRSGTVKRFVDEWYDLFTEDERMRLFEWTVRLTYDCRWSSKEKNYQPHFEPRSNGCGSDVEFVHRYHPDNQYLVTTRYEGKVERHRCFMMDGHYHLSSTRMIADEYIISVNHIPCPEWKNYKQDGVDYDRNIIARPDINAK